MFFFCFSLFRSLTFLGSKCPGSKVILAEPLARAVVCLPPDCTSLGREDRRRDSRERDRRDERDVRDRTASIEFFKRDPRFWWA